MDGAGIHTVICAVLRDEQDARRLRVLRRVIHKLILQSEWRRLMRTRHYVTVGSLKDPWDSPWVTLYTKGDDLSFLNMTSLTRCEEQWCVIFCRCGLSPHNCISTGRHSRSCSLASSPFISYRILTRGVVGGQVDCVTTIRC